MQRSRHYLRTDEHDDAVRSLEWATALCERVEAEPHTWKWQLLALHKRSPRVHGSGAGEGQWAFSVESQGGGKVVGSLPISYNG